MLRILSGRSSAALAVSGGYDRGWLQPQPALAMPMEAYLASKKRTGDMRSFFKASSIADKTKQEQLDKRAAASHFGLTKVKEDANAALQRRMEANHAADIGNKQWDEEFTAMNNKDMAKRIALRRTCFSAEMQKRATFAMALTRICF